MKKILCLICATICASSLFLVGCANNPATRQTPEPRIVTEEQPSGGEETPGTNDQTCPDANCDEEPCPDKDNKKIKPNFKFRPHRDIRKRKGDNAPEPPQPPVPQPNK